MKTPSPFAHARFAAVAFAIAAVAAPGLARPKRSADDALALVPADAVAVAVVRFSELRSTPLSAQLFAHADHMTVDGDAARFLAEANLKPKEDVDTVVVTAMSSVGGADSPALAIFEGRFDPPRLAAAAEARGAVRKSSAAGDYYLLPDKKGNGRPGAAAFVSSNLVIAGNESAVVQALGDRKAGAAGLAAGAGTLGRQLDRVDRRSAAWALVDVKQSALARKEGRRVHEESEGGAEPGLAIMGAMKSVSLIALEASARGDALEISLTGFCQDAETRQLIEDSVRGMLSMWRLAAQEKAPELVSALRRFSVKSDSESVSVKGTLPGSVLKSMAEKKKHTQ